MISKKIYLANPCKTYSIPYAKMKNFVKSDHLLIFHHEAMTLDQLKPYQVQTFFRIMHNLDDINHPIYHTEQINIEHDLHELVDMINACYTHENLFVNHDDLLKLVHHRTYDATLWLKIVEKGKIIASIIGCIDHEMREGWIEWVQVLPAYQDKKYGQSLINSLLLDIKNKVDFVTVSGNVDNIKDPEKVYRSCGFTGHDRWYICRK